MSNCAFCNTFQNGGLRTVRENKRTKRYCTLKQKWIWASHDACSEFVISNMIICPWYGYTHWFTCLNHSNKQEAGPCIKCRYWRMVRDAVNFVWKPRLVLRKEAKKIKLKSRKN